MVFWGPSYLGSLAQLLRNVPCQRIPVFWLPQTGGEPIAHTPSRIQQVDVRIDCLHYRIGVSVLLKTPWVLSALASPYGASRLYGLGWTGLLGHERSAGRETHDVRMAFVLRLVLLFSLGIGSQGNPRRPIRDY